MEAFCTKCQLPEIDKEKAAELLKESRRSLEICMSSSQMLLFNVEDLLALPQLKQGKLTKNIEKFDIKQAMREVSDIMDFKLKSKEIELEVHLKGFKEVFV